MEHNDTVDPLLAALASLVESSEIAIDMELSIAGLLIAGRLVPTAEYLREMEETLGIALTDSGEDGTSTSNPTEALGLLRIDPPPFIHVRHRRDAGHPLAPSANHAVWRISTFKVDGWRLDPSTGATDPGAAASGTELLESASGSGR